MSDVERRGGAAAGTAPGAAAPLPEVLRCDATRTPLLACGDPARGFCRIHCPSCASDLLLPFSCNGRGFCPSCGGWRMAVVAMHLTDNVIPIGPVGPCLLSGVLSVPWALGR